MPGVENVIETRASAFSRRRTPGLDMRARHAAHRNSVSGQNSSIEVLTPRRPNERTRSLIQTGAPDKRPVAAQTT